MNYNELNSHPRDSRLLFDPESHTYYIEGRPLKSVTTLVEECFPQFDALYWAHRKAPQEGLTPEELMAKWEAEACRARDLGTTMHDKIERYYLGEDSGDDTDAYRLFRCFAAVNRLYPFRTEWRIYLEEYGIAGTLDFLERTPDGTYNIYMTGKGHASSSTDSGWLKPLHLSARQVFTPYPICLTAHITTMPCR